MMQKDRDPTTVLALLVVGLGVILFAESVGHTFPSVDPRFQALLRIIGGGIVLFSGVFLIKYVM